MANDSSIAFHYPCFWSSTKRSFLISPSSPTLSNDSKPQTMQGTASGVCDPNSPILRVGSLGPKVQELQRANLRYGYLLERGGIDGKFGPATQNAVSTYQQENGLDLVDGIVGPRTWEVLCNSVTLIQQQQPPTQHRQQQQQNQESAVKQLPSGQTKPVYKRNGVLLGYAGYGILDTLGARI